MKSMSDLTDFIDKWDTIQMAGASYSMREGMDFITRGVRSVTATEFVIVALQLNVPTMEPQRRVMWTAIDHITPTTMSACRHLCAVLRDCAPFWFVDKIDAAHLRAATVDILDLVRVHKNDLR